MARQRRGSDGGHWYTPALQPRRQRSCVFVGFVAENLYVSSVFPRARITVIGGLRYASELAPRSPARRQAYGSDAAGVGSRGLRSSVFSSRCSECRRHGVQSGKRRNARNGPEPSDRVQGRVADQACLGRRPCHSTPLCAVGTQCTAKPWIRRRTLVHPNRPAPAPAFVCFRGFRG